MNARFAWAALALAVVGLIVWAFAALDSGPLTPGPNERLVQVVGLAPDEPVEFDVRRWPSGEVVPVRTSLQRAVVPANERLLVRVSIADHDRRLVSIDPTDGGTEKPFEVHWQPRPRVLAQYRGEVNTTAARMLLVPTEYTHLDDAAFIAWLEDTALAERALERFFASPSGGFDASTSAAVEGLLEWSLDGRVSRSPDDIFGARAPSPAGGSAVLTRFDSDGHVAMGAAHELCFWESGRLRRGADGWVAAWSSELAPPLHDGVIRVALRAAQGSFVFGAVPEAWSAALCVATGSYVASSGEVLTRSHHAQVLGGEAFWFDTLVPGSVRVDVQSDGSDGVLRVHSTTIAVGTNSGHEVVIPATLAPRVEFELVCSGVDAGVIDASFAADGAPFELAFLASADAVFSPTLRPRSRHFAVEGLALGEYTVSTDTGRDALASGPNPRPPHLSKALAQRIQITDSARIELPIELATAESATRFALRIDAPPGLAAADREPFRIDFLGGGRSFHATASWDESARRFVALPPIDQLVDGTYVVTTFFHGESTSWSVFGRLVVAGGEIVEGARFGLEPCASTRIAITSAPFVIDATPLSVAVDLLDGRTIAPVDLKRTGEEFFLVPPLPLGATVRMVGHATRPPQFVVTADALVRMEIVD
jgi:hypothetical protein